MKKCFFILSALLLAVSCTENTIDSPIEKNKKEVEKPKGTYSVTINGQKLDMTRGLTDEKALPGGKVVGCGLYDGEDPFKLQVFPDEGYRIKEFRGGMIKDDGTLLIKKEGVTSGQEHGDSYNDKVNGHDWNFKVDIVEACTVKVESDETGSVTIDNSSLSEREYCKGEKCTLTATPRDGYQFDGWYENGQKISSENPYSFVVSSNRTINMKSIGKNPIHKFQYTFLDSRNSPNYFTGEYLNSYFPLPENMENVASGILIQLPDVAEESLDGQSIMGIGFTIDTEISFSFPGSEMLKDMLDMNNGFNRVEERNGNIHIIQQIYDWGTGIIPFYQLTMPIVLDEGREVHDVMIPPALIKNISICFNHAYPNNLELTDVGYLFSRNFKSEYWGYAKLSPINNFKVYGTRVINLK